MEKAALVWPRAIATYPAPPLTDALLLRTRSMFQLPTANRHISTSFQGLPASIVDRQLGCDCPAANCCLGLKAVLDAVSVPQGKSWRRPVPGGPGRVTSASVRTSISLRQGARIDRFPKASAANCLSTIEGSCPRGGADCLCKPSGATGHLMKARLFSCCRQSTDSVSFPAACGANCL